jgi:putative transposase
VFEASSPPVRAERYATLSEHSGTLVRFPDRSSKDLLSEILVDGARRLLASAIEAEVQVYLSEREHLSAPGGLRSVVRNGHLPARTLQTPLGEVPVKQPRVRDRRPPGQRETFQSSILPAYLRRTKSLEELLPWLYLKGVSTGDFSEALAALLGEKARGLSATTITRLKSRREGFRPFRRNLSNQVPCRLLLPGQRPGRTARLL